MYDIVWLITVMISVFVEPAHSFTGLPFSVFMLGGLIRLASLFLTSAQFWLMRPR